MGMLDDIMKTLDRWEVWREIQKVPAKTALLEKRVADLEDKLNGKWPGDVCRYCGARDVRMSHCYPGHDKGIVTEDWICGSCGQTDRRRSKIK